MSIVKYFIETQEKKYLRNYLQKSFTNVLKFINIYETWFHNL